jgi:hypothetical protein
MGFHGDEDEDGGGEEGGVDGVHGDLQFPVDSAELWRTVCGTGSAADGMEGLVRGPIQTSLGLARE